MYIRYGKDLHNLDNATSIFAITNVFTGMPVIHISFVSNKHVELDYPDLATCERKLDEIQKAMQAGVSVFDMR